MIEFMNYDFNIDKIIVALFVATNPDRVHKNRPSHGLAVILSDGVTYIFDSGRKITVHAGEIIYLPKYSNYVVDSSCNRKGCYAINFELSEDRSFAPFLFKPKNAAAFLDHFKKAEQVWRGKKHGYMLKCKAELYDILYDMQTEVLSGYVDKEKREVILPAVEYIHDNYTNELLNITALSDMCGISPEYFRKLFRQFYGISPVKYINNLKISRAKELILSGMYTITQAAEMSGYTDMSHFSREFRKATGTAPSTFGKTTSC